MPKMKTHKGCSKRFKITASGKVKHYRHGKSHLLSVKSGKRKRRLRQPTTVTLEAYAKRIRWMMGEA